MKVSAKFSGWDEWVIPEKYEEEFKVDLAAGKIHNGQDVVEWIDAREGISPEYTSDGYEYLNIDDNQGKWTVEAEDGELTNSPTKKAAQ